MLTGNRLWITIIVMVTVLTTTVSPALATTVRFTDIEKHWAVDAITELDELEALDEVPPLFEPNLSVTRGKLARYLTIGWGIQPYTLDRQFVSDVPLSHPYFRYVNALYVRRLMVGPGGGRFGADDFLTREQAATVLVRAAGLEDAALARSVADAQAVVARYADAAQISPWAVPYVAQAYLAGLFLGDAGGTFRPRVSLSKAEAATVVSRIRAARQLVDFGDAPEWPPYFHFPSMLASDGARHLNYRSVWLGPLADGEIDSRQINDDAFDDGFIAFVPGVIPDTYHLVFTVSVADRDPSLYGNNNQQALFFNVLLDSDYSMKWEPDEWVVRNMRINPNDWPQGQFSNTLTTPAFHSPVDPYTCWYRLTLTWGEQLPDNWVGTGSFEHGETEDYGPEEQKLVVRERLIQLIVDWEESDQDDHQLVASALKDIVPLMDSLILQEQSEDPVSILVDKKTVILDRMYEAAELAHALGLSKQDVDKIFVQLWMLMAYVTEEEAKRYTVEILLETLRLGFGLPANISSGIDDILDQLVDLIYEQQIGDPPHVLLAKKDRIIAALQDLLDALSGTGLSGPIARINTALSVVKLIKLLELPVPPGEPPEDPPEDDDDPPVWGEKAPPLPALITGVGAIHELQDGHILIKIHLTSMVTTPVHDLEIYYEHQQWLAHISPVESPDGWEVQSGPAGVRFYGDNPLQPCTPVYIRLELGDTDVVPESIVIVLTDINSNPIGHGTSQRVRTGFIEVKQDTPTNIGAALDGVVDTGLDSFFDIYFDIGYLVSNMEMDGGVLLLEHGVDSLLPGGYAPEDGYEPMVGPIAAGQYYVVRDANGQGYALVVVESVSEDGCRLYVSYNPDGTLLMTDR